MNHSVQNQIDNELKVENFIPKQEMIKEFSGGYENEGFTHTVEEIKNGRIQVKEKQNEAMGIIAVYEVSENQISLIYTQEADDLDSTEIDLDRITPNREKIILKGPLKVGTKWTDDTDRKYEITGVNIKVETPAGAFHAIEVLAASGKFETKYYYVKNIGLVKSIYSGKDELLKIQYLKEE